jgi:hypothetical protein
MNDKMDGWWWRWWVVVLVLLMLSSAVPACLPACPPARLPSYLALAAVARAFLIRQPTEYFCYANSIVSRACFFYCQLPSQQQPEPFHGGLEPDAFVVT